MNILRPEDYQVREHAFPSHQVRVSSYRLGQTYYCTVDNVDPGAVIARAQGATRDQAEGAALARAGRRLGAGVGI